MLYVLFGFLILPSSFLVLIVLWSLFGPRTPKTQTQQPGTTTTVTAGGTTTTTVTTTTSTTPTRKESGCGCLVILVGIGVIVWAVWALSSGKLPAWDQVDHWWENAPEVEKVTIYERRTTNIIPLSPDKWFGPISIPRVDWEITTPSGYVTIKTEDGKEYATTPTYTPNLLNRYPKWIKAGNGKAEDCKLIIK